MDQVVEIAQKKAMKTLNDWVDRMMPKFNAIEMATLRTSLTAQFREYETKIAELADVAATQSAVALRACEIVERQKLLLRHCDESFRLIEELVPAVKAVRESIAEQLREDG